MTRVFRRPSVMPPHRGMRRGIAFWRVMQYLKWAAVIIGIALAVLMAMVLPATAAVLGVISVAGVVLVRMVKNDD